MYRLALWRLGCEIVNLVRLVTHGKRTVQYFAFGANLDPQVLKARRISPLSEKPFVLKDHELSFCHPGPFEGMGFASIEPKGGNCVYGKLHELGIVDALRMDFYE